MTTSLVSTGQIWDNLSINKNIKLKDISNIYTEKKDKEKNCQEKKKKPSMLTFK